MDIAYRPIRPDDVERLKAFHRTLSQEAIRLRFHGYIRELPDGLAHRFCEVDGQDRVAFVAVAGEPEQIVGVGRFDRQEGGEAEVAFVVADSYQRRGIGRRLLTLLIDAARERGITELVASVLRGNSAMRKMLEDTGFPIRVKRRRDADDLWMTLIKRPAGIP